MKISSPFDLHLASVNYASAMDSRKVDFSWFKGNLALLVIGSFLLLTGCVGGSAQERKDSEFITQREVDIRLDLADAYLRNNEPRMSLQELSYIREAAANRPRYHFSLGYTQFHLGNWEAAVEALRKTVELDPSHAEAWNNLGLAYLAGNRFESAEAAFTRALGVPTYRTPEIVALNMALLYMERNDPVKARQYVNLALELNWRFSRAYLLAAEIEVGQGDLSTAIELLERGVEADLSNTRMMLALAEYLLLAGRIKDARLWLERISTSASPDGRVAEMAEEYLEALDRQVWQPYEETTSFPGTLPDLSSGPESSQESKTKDVSTISRESTYIIQVGVFLDPGRAKALRDSYAAKGYPSGIAEIEHADRTWFLVFVDSSDDKEQALGIAELFQKREDAKAVITRIGMGRYLEIEIP